MADRSTEAEREAPFSLVGGSARSPRGAWIFFLGVFLTFAPVLMLSATVPRVEPEWYAALLWFAVSGIIGCGWALLSVRGLYWLIPVLVIFQIVVIAMFSGAAGATLRFDGAGVSLVGMGSVVLLALGYVFMVLYIRRQGVQALRLQTEMNLARSIHEHLVPPIDLATGRWRVSAISTPSSEMGGDLVDAVEESGGGVEIVLADVSGHGVRAGVLMAMLKSALRAGREDRRPVPALLERLNRIVTDLREPGMFITAAMLRVTPDGSVEHGLAGHLPILLRRDGTLHRLEEGGMPLGVVADATFEAGSLELRPGDELVLYSDGFTEAVDPAGAMLGEAAFERIVVNARGDDPAAVRASIEQAVADHVAGGPATDDRTLLVLRWEGG